MEPWIHFSETFLGAEEILGEGAGVGDGADGLTVVLEWFA